MDAVVGLTRAIDGGDRVGLQFTKARLRTPETLEEFQPRVLVCGPNGWVATAGEMPVRKRGRPRGEDNYQVQFFLKVFDELALAAGEQLVLGGEFVRKVKVDVLRNEMKRRGMLDSENGKLTETGKKEWQRAKAFCLTEKGWWRRTGQYGEMCR